MMRVIEHSTRWKSIAAGAMKHCPSDLVTGQKRLDMAAFECRQAQANQRAFAEHGLRYLFLGKSLAILLGVPDTTQDADLYVDKQRENCSALIPALHELGFELNGTEDEEIKSRSNGPLNKILASPVISKNFQFATWTILRASGLRTGRRTKSPWAVLRHSRSSGEVGGASARFALSIWRKLMGVEPTRDTKCRTPVLKTGPCTGRV